MRIIGEGPLRVIVPSRKQKSFRPQKSLVGSFARSALGNALGTSNRASSRVVKQERIAIEAVAKWFSGTWEKGSDLSDAYVMVGGKRVAVDITTLKRRGTGEGHAAKPRLRFDKVATRLIERLQATLGETVPDGMTVLLTITAPIRLPSKTAASLEDKIQTLLGRGSPARDQKDTIHVCRY